MGKLVKEIERAQSSGEVVLGSSFSSRADAVRSVEATLEVGDIFSIPVPFEVRGIDMGTKDRRGKAIVAEYIFVENQNGDARKLFPGMLNKRVRRYEKQENPGDPLMAVEGENAYATSEGSVSKKLREDYGSINKFFNDFAEGKPLAGKKIKVSKIDRILTKQYNADELVESPVYTFDFV